jgi:hypothetical protein
VAPPGPAPCPGLRKEIRFCQNEIAPNDGGVNDPEAQALIQPEGAFEPMRGTVPFQPGEHRRIAVKVIDFRGNEVVRIILLDAGPYG